jgi:hypothetical protein
MSQSNQACECCKAHWIEFQLCEELRCTSEKACARVIRHWQGELPPSSHCTTDGCATICSGVGNSLMPTVCVFNQLDGGPGTYIHSGVKGDMGIACYDDVQDRYRIVTMRTPTIVRFKLTANLSTGEYASAVLRLWDGEKYVDGMPVVVYDWWEITSHAPGAGRGMHQAVTGMEGWAVKSENHEGYDIVWMEQYAFTIAFTLTTDMQSQEAYASVDSSWEQGVEPPSTVTVRDVQNLFPRALAGAKGIAVRSEYADETHPTTPYYIVVACQQMCKLATAVLYEDMCDGEVAITNFKPSTFSPFNQPPDPLPELANNPHFLKGRQGDFATLAWDEYLDKWNVIQIQHKSQKVITDLRVNGYSVEYKTRICAVQSCELESPWTVLLVGANCSGNAPSSDSPGQ